MVARRSRRRPARALAPAQPNSRLWVASILITTVFCLVLIFRSLMYGALALPPVYDDISYFNDAASRLIEFYRLGLGGLLGNLKAGPPHAPLSTLLAFAGFSLFGIRPWAAVAANGVLLLFFVRLFFQSRKDCRSAYHRCWQSRCCARPCSAAPCSNAGRTCSALSSSASGQSACWRRRGRTPAASSSLQVLCSAWRCSAKPTVFHLTAALFWAAMFLASCPTFFRRQFARPIVAGVATTAVAMAVAAPYYIYAWRQVLDYIYMAVFSPEVSIWVVPLSLREHVLFYLTGETGQSSLGPWLYAGAVIGIAALSTLWVRGPRSVVARGLLIAAMVIVSYLAVTILRFKGPHGLPFAGVFLSAAALATVELARRLPIPAAWAFGVLFVGFSLSNFRWPYHREPVEHAYAVNSMGYGRSGVSRRGSGGGRQSVHADDVRFLFESDRFSNWNSGSAGFSPHCWMMLNEPAISRSTENECWRRISFSL